MIRGELVYFILSDLIFLYFVYINIFILYLPKYKERGNWRMFSGVVSDGAFMCRRPYR